MLETIIMLSPKRVAQRHDHEKLVQQLDEAIKFPGTHQRLDHADKKPAPTCFSTGIKTPVGIKISGANLTRCKCSAGSGGRRARGAYTTSAFAERAVGG